jgi:hypothetical protein
LGSGFLVLRFWFWGSTFWVRRLAVPERACAAFAKAGTLTPSLSPRYN